MSFNFIKEDIVIRLTFVSYNNRGYETLSEYVQNSKAILQPMQERIICFDNYEFPATLLKFKTLEMHVAYKEIEQTYIRLREDGYLFNDVQKK